MGKPGHERRRGDRGRGGAVDNRGDDARRYESEPHKMTNVAFGFSLPIRDLGERLAALDALDPFARLGDGNQQGLAAAGLHRGVVRRHMDDTLDRRRGRNGPRNGEFRGRGDGTVGSRQIVRFPKDGTGSTKLLVTLNDDSYIAVQDATSLYFTTYGSGGSSPPFAAVWRLAK